MMSIAIVDMDAIGSYLHTKAWITDGVRDLSDLFFGIRERMLSMRGEQCVGKPFGKRPRLSRRVHEPARDVGLAHRAPRMPAHFGRQYRGCLELGSNTQK